MIQVASLISKIVEVLGEPKRSGTSEWVWCCPLCVENGQSRPDSRYRLYVNPHKQTNRGKHSDSGFFFCQNCSAAGSVEYLLKRLGVRVEIKAEDWTSVLSKLADLGNPPSRDPDDGTAEDEASYPCETYDIEDGMESWEYLISRGLRPAQITGLRLAVGSGRWKSRIFFPNFNEEGRMNFWSARAFGSEGGPKYLTSPGSPRRERLYRYHSILRRVQLGDLRTVIVAEGPISAIMAGDNAVAAYGKYVTPEQQRMLVEMNRSSPRSLRFVLALDGDAMDFSTRLAQSLHSKHLDVSIIPMPYKHDPASLPRRKWNALRQHPVRYDGMLTGVRLSLCGI